MGHKKERGSLLYLQTRAHMPTHAHTRATMMARMHESSSRAGTQGRDDRTESLGTDGRAFSTGCNLLAHDVCPVRFLQIYTQSIQVSWWSGREGMLSAKANLGPRHPSRPRRTNVKKMNVLDGGSSILFIPPEPRQALCSLKWSIQAFSPSVACIVYSTPLPNEHMKTICKTPGIRNKRQAADSSCTFKFGELIK